MNEALFVSLDHARESLAIWLDDYNTVRPRSAIGNVPPAVYAKLSAFWMQRDGTLETRTKPIQTNLMHALPKSRASLSTAELP